MLLLFSPCFLVMLSDRDAVHGGAGTLCGDGSKQGLGGTASPSGWLREGEC